MKQYKQVVEFNQQVLKIDPRELNLLSPSELGITFDCLTEEVGEFLTAHSDRDIIGAIDAIIDLMYFAQGVLYKIGISPEMYEKIFTAVHEANMSKQLGVKAGRGDGIAADAIKPEGWAPPEARIRSILFANPEEMDS